MMAEQNALDGHNVTVITNCKKFIDGKLCNVEPEDSLLETGIRLIRVKYDWVFNETLTDKLRKVNQLDYLLDELKPDVILHHGINDYEILTVSKYKKRHPETRVYCDTHADYYTSATNWLSRYFLHGVVYKRLIHKAKNYIDKIFYITEGCHIFAKEVYGLSDNELEYLPLGGETLSKEERESAIINVRKELAINDGEMLFVHAGKMDWQKKTVELLETFAKIGRKDFKFAIIGVLDESIKEKAIRLIEKDDRIIYLGWKSGQDLLYYLNAADVYIQPGKVSAIAQNAICARCAVILNNLPDYINLVDGNGFLINSVEEIVEIITNIDLKSLEIMKNSSGRIAEKWLDYKNLSARLYQ
jgi:hypothetical protein